MGGRGRTCCLCGFMGERFGVQWCRICEHHFCDPCRKNLWQRDGRVMAWVKEWLFKNPPIYCQKEGHNERNT